jgi:hypothetical protein
MDLLGGQNKHTSTNICSSWTCKPNSVWRPKPPGRPFLWAAHHCAALATYPKVLARRADTRLAETRLPPYLVLLRVGFAMPAALLSRRCALTAPFHPYPCGRYVFCGTFRQPSLTTASRTLSGTLLCGVRTFLPRHLTRQERPSGPAAYALIIVDRLERNAL